MSTNTMKWSLYNSVDWTPLKMAPKCFLITLSSWHICTNLISRNQKEMLKAKCQRDSESWPHSPSLAPALPLECPFCLLQLNYLLPTELSTPPLATMWLLHRGFLWPGLFYLAPSFPPEMNLSLLSNFGLIYGSLGNPYSSPFPILCASWIPKC